MSVNECRYHDYSKRFRKKFRNKFGSFAGTGFFFILIGSLELLMLRGKDSVWAHLLDVIFLIIIMCGILLIEESIRKKPRIR